jgi:hypothetical protein
MTVRERAEAVFPTVHADRYSLFDMASVMWPKSEANKLRDVSCWRDLLDLPVDDMGPTGIGALLTFMEADLVISYLPAWLVLGYEHPFPYAGVLPALVVALDDQADRDAEEAERFTLIQSGLSAPQRKLLADTFAEIGDIHFRSEPELKSRLIRLANYWREKSLTTSW